jgi:hypothetical protein
MTPQAGQRPTSWTVDLDRTVGERGRILADFRRGSMDDYPCSDPAAKRQRALHQMVKPTFPASEHPSLRHFLFSFIKCSATARNAGSVTGSLYGFPATGCDP